MTPLLHYRRLGEQGPDLICLHGLYGAGRNWLGTARSLSASHRVWLPDLRNHGKSFHDQAWDYQVMAEDVAALATQLGLNRFALMGHSMGGKVAMQYALAQPDAAARLSHLVIVDIAPKPYAVEYHAQLLTALSSLDLSSLSSREQADQALAAAIPENDVRSFLLSNLARSESGWHWLFNLPVLQAKIDLITENIDSSQALFTACPVLFVAGADSDYIRPADEPLIHQHFPEAEIQYIPKAGHWVQADQPEALLASLRQFFAS